MREPRSQGQLIAWYARMVDTLKNPRMLQTLRDLIVGYRSALLLKNKQAVEAATRTAGQHLVPQAIEMAMETATLYLYLTARATEANHNSELGRLAAMNLLINVEHANTMVGHLSSKDTPDKERKRTKLTLLAAQMAQAGNLTNYTQSQAISELMHILANGHPMMATHLAEDLFPPSKGTKNTTLRYNPNFREKGREKYQQLSKYDGTTPHKEYPRDNAQTPNSVRIKEIKKAMATAELQPEMAAANAMTLLAATIRILTLDTTPTLGFPGQTTDRLTAASKNRDAMAGSTMPGARETRSSYDAQNTMAVVKTANELDHKHPKLKKTLLNMSANPNPAWHKLSGKCPDEGCQAHEELMLLQADPCGSIRRHMQAHRTRTGGKRDNRSADLEDKRPNAKRPAGNNQHRHMPRNGEAITNNAEGTRKGGHQNPGGWRTQPNKGHRGPRRDNKDHRTGPK
jgi:hypothetical protein